MYTKEDVLEFVEEQNVKFIRCAFFDVLGTQKNVSIQPSQLKRAFETGISFDGSAVTGFNDESHSDLILKPDPNTMTVLPWRSIDGLVIRMYCTIYDTDGSLYKNDTRYLLKQAIQKAEDMGVSIHVGNEFEFYLFEQGTKNPMDQAGYMDIAPDDCGEDVRRQICSYLSAMDVEPEASHHEQGPGQNEIDFRYQDPLIAADHAATFRWVVKTVAQSNGLTADFSPKPLEDQPGNGMHMHISTNNNMEAFLAGILRRIKEITLFLNPGADSYLRLGQQKAPRYISWGYANRSALVRIPAVGTKRFELRSPDCLANSYLAYTVLIYAGLEGIENQTELMAPTDKNIEVDGGIFEHLPLSLDQAKEMASHSVFVKKYVPENVLKSYL